MSKSVGFFLVMVSVFILITDNAVYSADNKRLAKNNVWVESFHKAVKELDSQQAYDIYNFIIRRLALGKYDSKTGNIVALEKKIIPNPIFLVLLHKEDKKDLYWKKFLSASSVQFVPAIRSIIVDDSELYSNNARALMFARVCWVAHAMCNGHQYDQNTEWRAQAFLTRFLECFGEDGYVSLAYAVADKLSQEISRDDNREQNFLIPIPKEYYEELWSFLWIPASEAEKKFVEECFQTHLAFIMIENEPGEGDVSRRKAEYVKSSSFLVEKPSKYDYNLLYRR